MIPASNATEASTIPGPPRAFVATARLIDEGQLNPAIRAPAPAATSFKAQARHDVFLSRAEPRARAFAELDRWLASYVEV